MKKISFCEKWTVQTVGKDDKKSITLPYDAMLHECRVETNNSGLNCAWFSGGDYVFEKKFSKPQSEIAILEFEGVYRDAEVYLNDELVCQHSYGYTGFFVDLSQKLKDENHLKVISQNADQPNSRWYSGSGIYRPVWLWESPREHVLHNGIRVRTLSINPAKIEVKVETSTAGDVVASIFDKNTKILSQSQISDKVVTFVFEIENAKLWSDENPYLYTLQVKFFNDEQSVDFGIRKLACDVQNGFTVNEKRIILRGCCIHHDNGILGACCYPEAEERKVLLLKKAGYNAIRSAHNPCSKALLDACDKHGVYVMDEYVDMWYMHKTYFDYASKIEQNYEEDIIQMIEKDFNHPSVIMYSLGNEVGESASKRGVEFFKLMKSVVLKNDDTRFVTVGINVFFNYLCSMGFGVYSDEKAKKELSKEKKTKVGSEFFNDLAGIFGSFTMKFGATLFGSNLKTRKIFAQSDVAGYNYGEFRYKKDLKNYPQRIICGSETFCSDAYKFYELAKKENRLIGDFVWAGIDYLGETGIGAWEYHDYAPTYQPSCGWISAGSGRLDLTGTPSGEALWTRVAYELESKPQIAVVPVNHTNDKHSPSAWKFTNALPSWSWDDCDGKKAKVEVYARAHEVELVVNGKTVGRKKMRNTCRAIFNCRYQKGTITAKAYDKNGIEIAQNSMTSAQDDTQLIAFQENVPQKRGLVFIRLCFADKNGIVKPLKRAKITVKVENGELLALGHGCPYNSEGYLNEWTDTYFGQALAVVKVDKNTVINATSELGNCSLTVKCDE